MGYGGQQPMVVPVIINQQSSQVDNRHGGINEASMGGMNPN